MAQKMFVATRSQAAVTLLIVIGILGAYPSQAQSPAARPQFETASVKLSASGGKTYSSWSPRALSVKNAPLRNLIQIAYHVRDFQVSGGPAWIESERYDVAAKPRVAPMEGGTTKESIGNAMAEMDLMLQTLLQESFKLKLRRETKELPVYALTVANGGVRMQQSKEGSCTAFDWRRNDPPPGQPPVIHCGALETGPNIRLNHTLDAAGMSIPEAGNKRIAGVPSGVPTGLTAFLSGELDRLVIDKTGLTGLFDFHLEWNRPATVDPSSSDEFTNPSLFTAVQEQLGLKLESTTGPVEVLVIDHAERPSEN